MSQQERAEVGGGDEAVQAHECPHCGADTSHWIGHEVRGVYDGVLFWSCDSCGRAWNRWADDFGSRRERIGDEQVALWEEARRAGAGA